MSSIRVLNTYKVDVWREPGATQQEDRGQGVKVTHVESGLAHCCARFNTSLQNRKHCIETIKDSLGEAERRLSVNLDYSKSIILGL